MFALLAALCNAVSVLTRHVASTADPDRPTGLRLAGYLLRNPRWLAGSAAQVGAFGFQAVALQLGQLSVVQPLLVTELVMALVLRRVWIRQAVAWAAWAAAGATCAGLAVFIVAAEPRGGHAGPTNGHWAAAGVAYLAVVGSLIILARSGSPARRAALYGVAGGITWALEATFIKSATNILAQAGLGSLFTQWPPVGPEWPPRGSAATMKTASPAQVAAAPAQAAQAISWWMNTCRSASAITSSVTSRGWTTESWPSCRATAWNANAPTWAADPASHRGLRSR